MKKDAGGDFIFIIHYKEKVEYERWASDNEPTSECLILMRPIRIYNNELLVRLENFMRAANGNHICLFPWP